MVAKHKVKNAVSFITDFEEALAGEALSIALRADRPNEIQVAYHYLADCALIRGDAAKAVGLYVESLRAAIRYGNRMEAVFELEGGAMALAGVGRDSKSMRLLGAALEAGIAPVATIHGARAELSLTFLFAP